MWEEVFDNKIPNIDYSFNNYFPNLYYINLDKRSDRRQHMQKTLSNINLSANRFPAVPSDSRGYEARLACKESHKNLIETAIKNNFNNICILEDDCLFIDNFHELFEKNIRFLPINWDILYIGHCFGSGSEYRIGENLYSTSGTYCTHAYCLNKKAYSIIIKKLNSSNNAIDHIYKNLCYHKIIKGYIIDPGLVHQIPNLSDIGEGPNSSKNLIL